MANSLLKTPYQTYHNKSYAAIDPTQPSLSTKSKSAALTGAGSGIGASIAISLAKSAVSYIALIGRREHALQKTKSAIEAVSTGSKVFIYAVDITNLSAIDAALEAFAQECASGKVDILVANAGSLGPLTSVRDADPAAWWSGFEINIKGNFNLIHAYLPRANSAAAIIYISSAVIHGPYFPNESSYCASKAGATKLFEYVHHEHPDMFVLSLQPGLVAETGMSAGFEHIANGIQMDTAALPWDDALPGDFVVWVVSPEARFLNGRFVWANWDVDELKADKEAILADPRKFTLGLIEGVVLEQLTQSSSTSQARAATMATDQERAAWHYQKELPADKSVLAKAWKLLESYSGIPPDEVDAHIIEVRDRAFAIFHYPCIGRWRFLDLYITEVPEYPSVLARLKAGESLLDVGCCFGHILRQLAFDGALAAHLAGTDLRPEFVDLGYELFRDRGRFAARFVTGDMLDPADAGLQSLDGGFDIAHAASFFHLFGWDDQVRAGERIVRFFKPGAKALVLGRQVGSHEPPTLEAYREKGEKSYHHNIESLQRLWDVIGENTGTKWRATGDLVETFLEDTEWVVIRFAVFKVE